MRDIKFPIIVGTISARSCPKCGIEIEPERSMPTAGEIAAQCLNPPPGEGVTVTQMAVRLPIAMKLRAAISRIKLEEAEWSELVNGVNRTSWLGLNEDVFAICRAILDAPEMSEEAEGEAKES